MAINELDSDWNVFFRFIFSLIVGLDGSMVLIEDRCFSCNRLFVRTTTDFSLWKLSRIMMYVITGMHWSGSCIICKPSNQYNKDRKIVTQIHCTWFVFFYLIPILIYPSREINNSIKNISDSILETLRLSLTCSQNRHLLKYGSIEMHKNMYIVYVM